MATKSSRYTVMAFSLTQEQALFLYKNVERGRKSAFIQELLENAMAEAKEQVEVEP